MRPRIDVLRRFAGAARVDPRSVTRAGRPRVDVDERAVRVVAAAGVRERLAERDDVLVLHAVDPEVDRASGRANGIAAITPERVIREGDPTEQILDVIDKDVDIAMLVLAANPGPEGPGPITTMIAGVVGSFPIPVVIVPGDLSDSDIDALS